MNDEKSLSQKDGDFLVEIGILRTSHNMPAAELMEPAGNTIHILFTPENGELQRRVLEAKGTAT